MNFNFEFSLSIPSASPMGATGTNLGKQTSEFIGLAKGRNKKARHEGETNGEAQMLKHKSGGGRAAQTATEATVHG